MPQTKHILATIEKTPQGMVAVASTASEDRQGEVVSPDGWELKNFKKNPLILWAHNHEEPAIGVSEKTWIEGTGKKARLMIKPVLHEVTERARAIKRLVELGIIRSLSVGFRPIDQDGNTFTKQELLEVSIVNVPANADAQMLAYKSLKDEGFDNEVIEQTGIPAGLIEKVGQLEERQKLIEGKFNAAVKAFPSAAPHPGRSQRRLEERISVAKVITRASDKLLAEQMPAHKQARLVKAIKLAGEQLIVSHKQELK